MADYTPSFFGSVLKAIACTPNNNPDDAIYETEVLGPCRRIRQMMAELGDKRPEEAEMRETLALLRRIFQAKLTDPAEREERFREILDRNQLHTLFPDLLSHRSGA